MKKIIILFALSIFLTSCGPDYILDEKIKIENNQWAYADSLLFSVDISDTENLHNLYLDVEHSTGYSFQNIYIQMHSIFPNGKRVSQQISVNLMDQYGRWKGNCNSEECDFRMPINLNGRFEETGNHTFIIEQFMRENPLKGIRSVAFRIENTGKTVGDSSK